MSTPVLFKLTPADLELFDRLKDATGQDRAGVLRLALRALAKREKIAVPASPKKTSKKSVDSA